MMAMTVRAGVGRRAGGARRASLGGPCCWSDAVAQQQSRSQIREWAMGGGGR